MTTRVVGWKGIEQGDPVRVEGQRRNEQWWFWGYCMSDHKAWIEVVGGEVGRSGMQRNIRSFEPDRVRLDKRKGRGKLPPMPDMSSKPRMRLMPRRKGT